MKVLEKYTIEINSVPGSVEIQEVDDENVPIYNITMPEFDIGTKSLLDTLTDVMAQRAPLEISEITDPKKIKELKDKIFDDTIKYIQSEFGDLDPRKSNLLAGLLLHRLYGIGQYELLLADDLLEEVVVNNSNTPLVVYHKRYGWLKTTQMMQSEDQIYNLSSQIGRKVNRSISSLNPIMDAHLLTGDRVASTLFPISTLGNTITIRKFARSPWSVTNLIAEKTMSKEIAALLWLAIMYELNVMVVGGTASGKCVSGDTQVFLPDRRVKIKDLVDEEFSKNKVIPTDDGYLVASSNLEVLSLNQNNLKIEKKKVSQVWKRKAPEYLIDVKTRTGRNIKVTPEHPFFIFDNGLQKVRADELNINSSIATPRVISTNSNIINFDLNKVNWYQTEIVNGQFKAKGRGKSKWVYLLHTFDPKLARFMGYVIGDGHIPLEENCVRFFNVNPQLLNDFLKLGENLFGIKGKIVKYGNRTPYVEFCSRVIAKYLINICNIPSGKKSHDVRILNELLYSDDECLKNLIFGLFESEVYISKESREIEFGSASQGLIEDISFILYKFGIINSIKHEKLRSRLFICGQNYTDFFRKIGMFVKPGISESLIEKDYSPNIDFVPNVGNLIKDLKFKLRMYDREIAFDQSRESISRYINNQRRPKRESLSKLVNSFRRRYLTLKDLRNNEIFNFDLDYLKKRIKDIIFILYKGIRLTTKELGLLSGVNKSTIWLWQEGKVEPSFESLRKVGLVLIQEYTKYVNLVNQADNTINSMNLMRIEVKDVANVIGIHGDSIYPYTRGEFKSSKYAIQIGNVIGNLKNEIRVNLSNLFPLFLELNNLLKSYNLPNKEIVKEIRTKLKLNNKPRFLSQSLLEIKNILDHALSPEIDKKIKLLENLSNSDIFWDEIIEVKKIKPDEEWVYDLTVDGNHTFIANNVIVHNTSLLNSLMTFIPPNQRVISIEDTREIQLASTLHWNWVPLTTRAANPEGQGEVTMLDLMVASLRMRPDRIIVGEVRRKEQAEVMFEAMHTGHSVYTTMHADTVQQIRRRLMEEPFAIPKAEVEALQLVVVQYRDRRKNVRRTLEVAEILVSGKTDLDINYLYRWRPRKDVFEKADTSVRLYEDLNLHTGMTIEEIESDLRDKEMILQWLVDYKFTDNDKLGKIFKIYYKTSQVVIEAARNNLDPESLLKND